MTESTSVITSTEQHASTSTDDQTPYTIMTTPGPIYPISWNEWLPWTQCTLPCGGGTHFRLMVCATVQASNCSRHLLSTDSGLDIGYAIEVGDCNIDPCPIDGFWLPWQPWGACSGTCGIGVSQRRRLCTEPMYGGNDCGENDHESKLCSEVECAEKIVRIESAIKEVTFTEADKRASAKMIGSSAVLILAISGILILLLDATSIRRHFGYMKSNIQSRLSSSPQYKQT
ncbi:hypothetical protein CAPTEDRAFT_161122 [Capitella teleta]|uniref:ADAMTS cysteine-rich domain-containing protein n=1 Tax=Capitella teleta TaxID=283909 RepID=R7V429_CAPTE|nr:hypothetical protein CAPTEDRAFT_161122 [Capitella teleta]|eukprot:ELU11111.1 hypothetical protein CAPTEDRAFT_161122 [Capitella teleta]